MILTIREHALFADMRKRQHMAMELHLVRPARAVTALGPITAVLNTADSVHADIMIMQTMDTTPGLRSAEPSTSILAPPADTPKLQIIHLAHGPR